MLLLTKQAKSTIAVTRHREHGKHSARTYSREELRALITRQRSFFLPIPEVVWQPDKQTLHQAFEYPTIYAHHPSSIIGFHNFPAH